MNPERKVEIILWDWLITKSKLVEKIYFNSINEVNAPIFHVVGKQKKPDFIIKTSLGYCAIEIKDNIKSNQVRESCKIIDIYLKNYCEGKTKYLIEEKEIKIDYFLVATQDSINCKLFKDRDELINNFKNKNKKQLCKWKLLPYYEGTRTHDFVRGLFLYYKKIRKNLEIKPSIGILIGDFNNKNIPSLQVIKFDELKNRWTQRWINL